MNQNASKGITMLVGIKHKTLIPFGCVFFFSAILACGGSSSEPIPDPTPDVEATVQARLAEEKEKEKATVPLAPKLTPAAVPPTAVPPKAVPMPAPVSTGTIKAGDLVEEFTSNAIGASQRYKGQDLTVEGEVTTIDYDLFGNPYIALGSGALFEINTVWCMVSDISDVTGVAVGDATTVEGTFTEWDGFDVELKPCSVQGGGSAPAQTPAPVSTGTIKAGDLVEEFTSNAIGASQRYKGQDLTVEGEVTTIDYDLFGNPYIALGSGALFEINTVWCMVSDISDVTGVAVGDATTVEGTFTEWDGFDVELKPCSVQGGGSVVEPTPYPTPAPAVRPVPKDWITVIDEEEVFSMSVPSHWETNLDMDKLMEALPALEAIGAVPLLLSVDAETGSNLLVFADIQYLFSGKPIDREEYVKLQIEDLEQTEGISGITSSPVTVDQIDGTQLRFMQGSFPVRTNILIGDKDEARMLCGFIAILVQGIYTDDVGLNVIERAMGSLHILPAAAGEVDSCTDPTPTPT
ncbi:hypothetical protein M1O55_02570, partial [Dehalococcoidia bacterium]|nr:hypothetical protein [Dehalococcoidia bacterium]